MHILAIADRPPREKISSILAREHVDLIVTLGDLDYFDIAELANVTDIPKLGVYGNHDSGTSFESLGIINMHLGTFTLGGLVFGGFEGCVRYKTDPYAKMYTQEQATQLLAEFPTVNVMLVHCPPFGVNDEPSEIAHQGFHGLRTYVQEKRPRYLLHGHTYPKEISMVKRFLDTEVVYVHKEKVLSIY